MIIISKHPVLEYYRKLLLGEISIKEYSKIPAEKLKRIVTVEHSEEIKKDI